MQLTFCKWTCVEQVKLWLMSIRKMDYTLSPSPDALPRVGLSPRERRQNEPLSPRERRQNELLSPRERRQNELLSPRERRQNELLSPRERRQNEPFSPRERRQNEPLSPRERRQNEPLSPRERRQNEPLSPRQRRQNEPLSPRERRQHEPLLLAPRRDPLSLGERGRGEGRLCGALLAAAVAFFSGVVTAQTVLDSPELYAGEKALYEAAKKEGMVVSFDTGPTWANWAAEFTAFKKRYPEVEIGFNDIGSAARR